MSEVRNPETFIRKSKVSGWLATTRLDLPELPDRADDVRGTRKAVLKITTSAQQSGFLTRANVVWADDSSESFLMFKDFSVNILATPCKRCTEKGCGEAHSAGLMKLEAVKAAAINHYKEGV